MDIWKTNEMTGVNLKGMKYKMVSLREGYDLRKAGCGLNVWLLPLGSIIPELHLFAFQVS